MGIIDLLRHGEVEGGDCFRGFSDEPLTKMGWSQMQYATKRIGPWQHIISSPLQRCSDFARYCSNHWSIPMTLEHRFKEMNFGDWEGRNAKDIMQSDAQTLTDFWQDPDQHKPPNGESLAGVQSRVIDAWNEITNRHYGKRILVIGHGGPIRIIIGSILKIPNNALLNIELPLASINRVRVNLDEENNSYSSVVLHGSTNNSCNLN